MARTIKHGDTWFIDDENYDYSTEIQKAVDAGDYQKAAYLEKSRNAKIDRFTMPYDKTYAYQDFLPGKYDNPPAVPAFEKGSNADKANRTLSRAQAMNFHYDANKDPLYKQIKKNYQNTANDVIENTMGSYAGMTGGVPSSYAASAAAQAGAAHLQKADDMIPELYQLAYSKYADDKADLYKQYGIYQGLENQEYNRQQNERNWEYQLGRDKVADERYATEWQYGVDRDKVADEHYATEWDYTVSNDEKNDASNNVMTSLAIGVPPSQEDLYKSGLFKGMTPEEVLSAYKAANAPKVVYSGGGSRTASPQLKKPTKSMYDEIDKLFEEGDGFDGLSKLFSKYDWETYDKEALESYIRENYSNEPGVKNYYQNQAQTEGYNESMTLEEYAEATAYKLNQAARSGVVKIDKNGNFSVDDKSSYDVINAVLSDESLTDDQAFAILNMYGITQKQLDNYVN